MSKKHGINKENKQLQTRGNEVIERPMCGGVRTILTINRRFIYKTLHYSDWTHMYSTSFVPFAICGHNNDVFETHH